MPKRLPVRLASLSICVAGCTGLDPGAFRSRGSPPSEPEGAGWSFDAGSQAGAGGRGGSGAAARGGTVPRSGGGGGAEPRTGAGGEAEEAGAAGAPADPGSTGGLSGGFGGSAGARGGSGAAGHRAGDGGVGGRASGGASTRAGAAGEGAAAPGGAGQGAAGQSGGPAVHAFYFSEYVEGSSSYKALEITAREASTLAGCRLVTYFNGSSAGTGLALDGTLGAGTSYVLCSTALAGLLDDACGRATNLTFNGDDAVALECDGLILDVIGQIGVDPGDAWQAGEVSTLNQTLRRACAASAGDRNGSDAFEPTAEWTAFPVDSFDDLGHTECGD